MGLYKYYSPESFDFIFIENGISIRFSQPSVLNDIFELNGKVKSSFDYEFDLIIDQAKVDYPETKDLKKEEILPFIKKIQQLQFSKVQKNIKSYIDEYYGILSLTENPSSLLMWAHYSKNHTGYMIEFDEDNDLDKIMGTMYATDSVEYKNERPTSFYDIAKNGLSEENKAALKELIYTKSSEWHQEEEFRIVVNLDDLVATNVDDQGFPIHTIKFPSNSIKAIYLGVRSSEALERKAKFWIDNNSQKTKLFKAETCSEKFELIYSEIETRHTSDAH